MYTSTSSRSASYTLPRSSTYTSSSRYSDYSSNLPPISSRYLSSSSSKYSDTYTSSYKSTYNRPTTYLSGSRYTSSAPSELTQSWRSTVTSPLSSRKSSITNSATTSGYVSRRPSVSSGRNDSITSLASLYSIETYRPKESSYRHPSFSSASPLIAKEEREWVPRSSRIGSISSSSGVSSLNASQGLSYKSNLEIGSGDTNNLASGRIGLNNLGNTCFMNAVLQCLCHTQPLVDYCRRENFNTDINHRSPSGGNLIKAFAHLTQALWSHNTSRSVSPEQLRREIQKYAPTFTGYSQQDAQELLRYLLQGLHDDINRVASRINRPVETTSSSSPRRASESWRQYRNFEDSQIVDIFAGQLKSTLRCTDCGTTSCSFDPFWDLSLPIPGTGNRFTLQQCFRFFTSQETLDGSEKPYCERCKTNKRSTKTLEINKFPMILVIHLKRFDSDSRYRNKLNIIIECPDKNLDLSTFASNDCMNSTSRYNLYGVVDHIGTALSGHYIAKCKDLNTSEWNEYNDSSVSSISSDIVTEKAYLLFYEQQGRRFSRL